MEKVKENLLKSLVTLYGDRTVAESLVVIKKTYDILEKEIVKGLSK